MILYNLASSNENCALMLEAGALMHVVHLTQAPLSATKMKCAAILSRLSLHAKHYDQFSRHDVLRVLLELCNVDNIMTQRRLVIAISNLSQVSLNFSFLAHPPPPPLLRPNFYFSLLFFSIYSCAFSFLSFFDFK